jgi:hypothetical protein
MALLNENELRVEGRELNKSLAEASLIKLSSLGSAQTFDIFLSQRKQDFELVNGFKKKLEKLGFSVYVDWATDRALDRENVTKETVNLLRQRLQQAKCLFYLATDSASHSKWMPWELGFKDGHSKLVAIVPVAKNVTSSDEYKGMEYLGAYPYVTIGNDTKGNGTLWIRHDSSTYTDFKSWLSGVQPYRRS